MATHVRRRRRVPSSLLPRVTPRSPLRDLTRAEHEAVDRLYSRFDLSQAAGYRAFLAAQASAFLAIEAALDSAGAADFVEDWPERRRSELLKADLAELCIDPPRGEAPPLPSEADLLGGIYVLEGSRLGGALLSSRLPAGTPARFLAARSRPGAWRKLLILRDRKLERAEAREAAAEAARAAFRCFEQSALTQLEPSPA